MGKESSKHFAGRQDGGEHYQFGDLSRGVIRKLRGNSKTEDVVINNASKDLSLARKSLEDLIDCSNRLSALEFPRDADYMNRLKSIQDAIGVIKIGLIDFENMVREAEQNPLIENVVQTQMCTAAKGQEWSVGQLVIRTDGLVFRSRSTPQWTIGPVLWGSIESLQRFTNGDLLLSLEGENRTYTFSGVADVSVLETYCKLHPRPEQSWDLSELQRDSSLGSSGSDDNALQTFESWMNSHIIPQMEPLLTEIHCARLESPRTNQASTLPLSPRLGAQPSDGYNLPRIQHTGSFPIPLDRGDPHSPRLQGNATTAPEENATMLPDETNDITEPTESFRAVDEKLPEAKMPRRSSPVLSVHLKNVSIDIIRESLHSDDNWPLRLYLEQELNSHDMKVTSWVKGVRIPGTHVRRLQFQMPVPADVPTSIRNLVNLPSETAVTLVARIGSYDDLVILLLEIVTHDVTFGNDFVVQEVFSFKAHPAGGSTLEKYVEVQWVNSLPWYAKIAVGSFVEMKAKGDGKRSGQFLQRYLEERSAPT